LAAPSEDALRGTIYLVDGDPEFSDAARRLLEMAGYQVLSFPSAERLLEQQGLRDRVGCILLDVRLPALTAPDLQQQLIGQNVDLPLIFLSGYEDIPDVLVSTVERAIDMY